jgi:hypothetical protein
LEEEKMPSNTLKEEFDNLQCDGDDEDVLVDEGGNFIYGTSGMMASEAAEDGK